MKPHLESVPFKIEGFALGIPGFSRGPTAKAGASEGRELGFQTRFNES